MNCKKTLYRVHFSPDRLEKARKDENVPKWRLSLDLCGNPNALYDLLRRGWTRSPRLAFGLIRRYGKGVLATKEEVLGREAVDFDALQEVLLV